MIGFQQLRDHLVVVKFVNNAIFAVFVGKFEGRRIALPNGRGVVTVTNLYRVLTYVSVRDAPFEMPNDTLVRVLGRSGRVHGIRFNRHTKDSVKGCLNGHRTVHMEITSAVPSAVSIAGHNVHFFDSGQVQTCFKCGLTGHFATNCTMLAAERVNIFREDGFPLLSCDQVVVEIDSDCVVVRESTLADPPARGVSVVTAAPAVDVPGGRASAPVVRSPGVEGAARDVTPFVDSVSDRADGGVETSVSVVAALEGYQVGGGMDSDEVPLWASRKRRKTVVAKQVGSDDSSALCQAVVVAGPVVGTSGSSELPGVRDSTIMDDGGEGESDGSSEVSDDVVDEPCVMYEYN